jgi:hypothetical protein
MAEGMNNMNVYIHVSVCWSLFSELPSVAREC